MNNKTATPCDQNNVDQSSSAYLNRYAPYGDQYLYISAWKVFFMLLVPGYLAVWIWRNWRIYRARQQSHKGVFWRTVFYPFMCYPLFKDMFSSDKRPRSKAALFMLLQWLPFILSIILSIVSANHFLFLIFFLLVCIVSLFKFALVQFQINKFSKKPLTKRHGYSFQYMSFPNYLGAVTFSFVWIMWAGLFFVLSMALVRMIFAKEDINSWSHSAHYSVLSEKVYNDGPKVFCHMAGSDIHGKDMLIAGKQSCESVVTPMVHQCIQDNKVSFQGDKFAPGQAGVWVKEMYKCSMGSDQIKYKASHMLDSWTNADVAKHCGKPAFSFERIKIMQACYEKRGEVIYACYKKIVDHPVAPKYIKGDQLASYHDKVMHCVNDAIVKHSGSDRA